MSQNTIEVEAESIIEARERAKSLLPTGHAWRSELIASDGKPKTIQLVADTIEDAFARAQEKIPQDASIIEKKILEIPRTETISIVGMNESDVQAQIRNKYGDAISIKALEVTKKGSRGWFGVGAKPGQYEAIILFPATVGVIHTSKVRLIVEFVDIETRVKELTKDLRFHSPSEHEEVDKRSQAISKLEELRHPIANESLVIALDDRYYAVQDKAAIALGRLGDKRAVNILIERLGLYESHNGQLKTTVSELVDATQSLLRLSAEALNSKDLESLAQLKDLHETETVHDLSDGDDPYVNTSSHEETVSTVSMSTIRLLAQQELTRRLEA